MPRYVVIEHDHPHRHWDLMLESGEALRTWRLAWPLEAGVIQADALPDHRLVYLDYEGTLSGGRGTIARRDAGTFEWIEDTTARVVVQLDGQKYRGRMSLRWISGGSWEATYTS